MASSKLYMGIDLGSVSLNLVVIDEEAIIRASHYSRTKGRPLAALQTALDELGREFDPLEAIVATGSGRKLLASILDVPDANEIVTQATAACHFHPHVCTIIEIGGQDSKLIFVDHDPRTGQSDIVDHVLNEVCAAGTGSFLDLQAQRLGMTIDDFGALALCSDRPARISGRCSVFAKSDMVHLLQEGTPRADIVAGLCHALARNFITNLAKGKPFAKPIVFQGGVAANPGVIRAFEQLLGLDAGSLVIPEHFLVMGAFGSALIARSRTTCTKRSVSGLIECVGNALEMDRHRSRAAHLEPLTPLKTSRQTQDQYYGIEKGDSVEVFLGIDVGAVSTNIILIDRNGRVVAKQYRYSQGAAVNTLRAGLEEMALKVGSQVRVCGVGVTGSGRYFIGDFVGADVVINEISAQARAALHLDPLVDTIIEIGGQDSKYIRCKNERVVDFEMNKVCAAGTGSFLEEQAARLKVPIRESFSGLAFSSSAPADLGARCTVFMESDLIHYQQVGHSLEDLAAGLSYAIAHNYLEKVVGTKRLGQHIVFQGGVAGNQSVAAAFENILGKSITISEHHNVTGAVGAALTARDYKPDSTKFAGFYLKERPYKVKGFECQQCPNLCRINQVYVEDKLRSCYGSLCGRHDRVTDPSLYSHLPDLFEERHRRLIEGFDEQAGTEQEPGRVVGIPRTLGFFEYFPFWRAFFEALGQPIAISETTNKSLVEGGLSYIPSETCFPIKTVYGHVNQLISKGVDTVLLACEIDCPQTDDEGLRSFNCPYIQSIPYLVRAAMGSRVKVLAPVIRRSRPRREVERVLIGLGKSLGYNPGKTRQAVAAAYEAQGSFDTWRIARGRQVLASMQPEDRALVLLGKPHNIFDPGLNLHLARKLRRAGLLAIPYDMLPLERIALPAHYDNVVWKNTRDLLKTLVKVRSEPQLFPILLTNFGCGPDSFFMKYLEAEIPDKPYLVLEVDDHTGDAGMVTRIEAFLDTLDAVPKGHHEASTPPVPLNLMIKGRPRTVDPWNPDRDLMRRLNGRVVYFPYVSLAFSSAVQAAFEAIGVESRILPQPDDETEYLGRQVTSSRECHPFIVTCGDFVQMTKQPGFDPDRAAVWMANYDGACRFSQYTIGHADVFRRLGLSRIPVIAPVTSTRFDELSGLFGMRFTRSLWQGWMATEVLERIRLHTRPYEKNPGQTDRVFEAAVRDVATVIARQNGRLGWWNRDVGAAMTQAVKAFRTVPVDMSVKRPTVGIVGEFYTVLNARANHDLIRTLERLGAEVRVHGLTVSNCFTLFSEHYYAKNCLKQRRFGSALYYFLRNQWIMHCVKQTEAHLEEELRPFGTLRADTIINETAPFIHYDIDPILATLTTRVRRFAASGISGICNLFVLNCMLGNVAVPVFKNALQGYQHLPVLHAAYDGQKETNMITRVEAFMHQAKLYHERYGLLKSNSERIPRPDL